MRRPYGQDDRGFAAYMIAQRRRQERDEREHHFEERNAEQTPPHAYTRAQAQGSAATGPVDVATLAAQLSVVHESHRGVEPIALESGRQLVVGESGFYFATFNVQVQFEPPTDPDDLFMLHSECTPTHLYSMEDDRSVDSVGLGQHLSATLHDIWPIRIGDEVQGSFTPSLMRAGGGLQFDWQVHLTVAWYAPAEVAAPSSS